MDISEELRKMLDSNDVDGVYKFGEKKGNVKGVYQTASEYLLEKGDFVMALAYAESCQDTDMIDKILENPKAYKSAWSFVGPEMEMMIRHMTPFAIAHGLPEVRMYYLLRRHEDRKAGRKPSLW